MGKLIKYLKNGLTVLLQK